MSSSIHSVLVGQTWRAAGLVKREDGAPITANTVNYYLKALTGANAGKWYRNSDSSWQDGETANAMAHQADGLWTLNLTASPFAADVMYLEYAKESADLHVPANGRLLRGQGVVDAVNVTQLAGGTYKIASTTGNWATAGTWASGVVPAAGDNIIIRDGKTVTVAASLNLGQFGTLELQGDGALSIASGQTVAVVPTGWVVKSNGGTITVNSGTVTTSSGTVTNNWGTVTNNDGMVTDNYGTVTYNNGTVTNNWGTITNNSGTVTDNYGTVTYNWGTVTYNWSTVTNNSGTVTNNDAGGVVFNVGGTVGINNGKVYEYQTGDSYPNAAKLTFLGNRVKAAVPPTHGAVGSNEFFFSLSVTPREGLVLEDASESTVDLQEKDRIKHTTTHVAPTVGTQWLIEADVLQHDLGYDGVQIGDPPITLSSSNEAVATIDAAGRTHYISAGPVCFIGSSPATANSPAREIRTETLTCETNEPAIYDTVTYTDHPGSCREDATAAIDARIAVGGKLKPIYSTQDHATPAYVRNVNCWAADLDLTCISPWNSTGGITRAGTLISPRHLVWANHYSIPNGATIRFVDASNNVVTRTVVNSQRIGTSDLRVGVLDSDVTGCGFAKALPDDWANYLPNNGAKIPCLALDQQEKAIVTDLYAIVSDIYTMFQVPTDATRLEFYEKLISGDSGNPAFLVIDGELVILTVWTWGGPGLGFSVTAYKAAIEAAMVALGGGYTTLTEIDLSGFTTY